jgi:hypothetical protein
MAGWQVFVELVGNWLQGLDGIAKGAGLDLGTWNLMLHE